MKYLLFLLVIIPGLAQAHCPYEVNIKDQSYCIDILWDQGEKKVKGQFESVETLSPVLIAMGEVPQKWIYSKAIITTWLKGDSKHTPVEIPHFRVFPYMHMNNGHHHSTGYEFLYDSLESVYVVQRIAFQQMPGCWSLRWTTDTKDQKNSSHLITNLSHFTNLEAHQIEEQISFCQNLTQTELDNGESESHHDHH